MICSNPNCKSVIPDDSKFCPDCGTPVVNTEEIRAKAKEIVSNYKQGYKFYVNNGTLPRFVFNSTIENCEKIIAKKQDIIKMHNEILQEEKRIKNTKELEDKRREVKQIYDSYKKGYDNLASRGIMPYYKLNYSLAECEKIILNRSMIILTHNSLIEAERRQPKYETFSYTDGSRYEGYVVNGVRQGKGTYYFANGGRYVGDWLNDKRHGKGTDYYTNGDRYEGDFKNDKREGHGTYFWSNGSSRSNEWKNDTEITPSTPSTDSEESPFVILFGILVIIGSLFAIIFFIRSLLIDFNII